MLSRAFEPEFARPADRAACREMIRVGSRSFHMASFLLPDDVREAAYALYAFCRLSDDAVDEAGARSDAVGRLRDRLDRIYAGDPWPQPVDRALADMITAFAMPRALLDALLEGLEWDVEGRTYETLADLEAYAARVAGAVGAMMAVLMGAREPSQAARACDLGVAMQLTNIARDVGEDARMKRLYLPRAWLREEGLDPDAWLANPTFSPAIGRIVARLLDAADELYRRADRGIASLDPTFRPAIFAARYLYAEIGAQLSRRGLDSVARRTRVSSGRKAVLVMRAVTESAMSQPAPCLQGALPATQFLVEAIGREPTGGLTHRGRAGRSLRESALRIFRLFEALEARSGLQRALR